MTAARAWDNGSRTDMTVLLNERKGWAWPARWRASGRSRSTRSNRVVRRVGDPTGEESREVVTGDEDHSAGSSAQQCSAPAQTEHGSERQGEDGDGGARRVVLGRQQRRQHQREHSAEHSAEQDSERGRAARCRVLRCPAHAQMVRPASTTASSSISTFQRGSSSPATTTIVLAGRTSPNTSPWTTPTASPYAASTTYWRVRITSSTVPPSSSSAASMISQHRRAWTAGSGSTLPSGHTGAVPLTAIVLPTRTARLNPMVDSNGDPERACWRSMVRTLGHAEWSPTACLR